MTDPELSRLVLSRTRDVPDFPKPGVLFKDVTPLFADATVFGTVIDAVAQRWRGQVDVVAGVEARGFIVGTPLALALQLPFVPVRKAGKLPGPVHARSYDLEYGTATLEVQQDALGVGRRVLVVDDILATGGTAAAAAALIEDGCGASVAGFLFLLELSFLSGRDALNHEIQSLAVV